MAHREQRSLVLCHAKVGCSHSDVLRYGLSAAPSLDQLSLRELEAFPCPGLTGFFAFFHARIATEQSFGFKRCSVVSVGLQEGSRNRKPGCASLASCAATCGIDG